MTLQEAYTIVESKIIASDPQVKRRLDRAYDIIRTEGQGYVLTKSMLHGQYIWHIHKASTAPIASGIDSSQMYTVDSDSCNCPDAATARGKWCKHKLAVMIKEVIMQ